MFGEEMSEVAKLVLCVQDRRKKQFMALTGHYRIRVMAKQPSVARIRIHILTINFNYLNYVHKCLMMT
jgi:hypothetical protein